MSGLHRWARCVPRLSGGRAGSPPVVSESHRCFLSDPFRTIDFERVREKAVRVEQGFFERLTEIMAAMAAGDTDALGALHEEYRDPIRGAVRKELARLGVTHLDAAEVDGLAVDVCAELFRRARAWSPEHNTLPWTWAKLRVRAIVVAYVGHFTDPLPEGGPPAAASVAPPAGPADEPVLETLGRLAAVRRDLRLLEEALHKVSRPAQQQILFEFRMQANQGDPSPAVTVARAYALRPEAVRQTCKRLTDKVRRLATTDPYFAPLADLHLLRRAG
jgi:hypothetical protein